MPPTPIELCIIGQRRMRKWAREMDRMGLCPMLVIAMKNRERGQLLAFITPDQDGGPFMEDVPTALRAFAADMAQRGIRNGFEGSYGPDLTGEHSGSGI